jgi:hypothetical protein
MTFIQGEDRKAGRSRGAVIVTAHVYTLFTHGPTLETPSPRIHLSFGTLSETKCRLYNSLYLNSETARSGQAK